MGPGAGSGAGPGSDPSFFQESPSSWLDAALPHISEMIQLEDVPSIQMEVALLLREFPDIRY